MLKYILLHRKSELIPNIKYYGGEFEIADRANIRDGLLDLVIINRKNPWDITMLIFSIASGKLNKFKRKEDYQTKKADIYSHYNMQIQVDGEVLGVLR
jgi:diacylglycerol kinase family enzyme